MYNSQYYTCEQIDERLLQGYLDDYNTQTGQNLTKEQFLTKLGNVFAKETVIDNTAVNIRYFVCNTAAGTAAKVITVAGYELFQGGSIKVKFNNRNTAGSVTLNINSKGAKALYYGGKPVSASNSWDNNEIVEIYYDGTNYYANNVEGNFKDGIFDISAYNLTEGQPTKYATLAEALGTDGNNVPSIFRKGGMQIKYVSTSDNKYVHFRLMSDTFNTTSANWQGVDDEPTAGSNNLVKSGGVESKISDCKVIAKMFSIKKHWVFTSAIDGSISGIAVGDALRFRQNNSFSVSKFKVAKGQVIYIPFVLNKNTSNPVIVDDNDIVLQIGDQSASSSTVQIKAAEYWPFTVQYDGYLVYTHYDPDDMPLYSDNAAMRPFDNPYAYVNSETSGEYMNFVKACYVKTNGIYSPSDLRISNVRRNYNGSWLVKVSDGQTELAIYSSFVETENIVVHATECDIYLSLNWNVFTPPFNNNVDIHFSNKVFIIEGNPIGKELMEKEIIGLRVIGSFAEMKQDGYVATSQNDGTPLDIVGRNVEYATASNWWHIRIPVMSGETLYVPYLVGNYTVKNPIIVDGNDRVMQIGDYTSANAINVLYENNQYWKIVSLYDGYLIFSFNRDFYVYSGSPNVRPSVVSGSSVPFDFEVAKSMDHSLLRSIIESASNGKCTVLYDNNGYPNLMYKIPLMSVGMFSEQLGDMDTPHPAFVVNGITKKCIYAGVFMNADYNGVPVSWFGLGNIMRSKSFFECRTLCAAKGDGWHLETIWERSLISLLSAKHHNNKPRGNNCWGRSRAEGFEYECVERVDGKIPGTSADSNGCQWVNGTEPDSWSHNNSRWGIFDIVGGYHEFCNLVKIVDGQIYIANDNKYNADESEWIATGIYVGHNNQIQFSASQQPVESGLKTGRWSLAVCTADFDSINIAIRKKVVTALMCPRLSSEDDNPVFDFDGSIWVQRLDETGYTTYPFLGGAEEYENSGLGMNIMSYEGDAAHNNMGSRLFYIE